MQLNTTFNVPPPKGGVAPTQREKQIAQELERLFSAIDHLGAAQQALLENLKPALSPAMPSPAEPPQATCIIAPLAEDIRTARLTISSLCCILEDAIGRLEI